VNKRSNSKTDAKRAQNESKYESELAIELLLSLGKLLPGLPGHILDNVAVADVTLALACSTSQKVPWSTSRSAMNASLLTNHWLQVTEQTNKFWPAIEFILKERIRPLFAKTPNPAITAAGRKNFHPQSVPRFDGMDESAKPWKTTDVYVATALEWMIERYTVCHPTTFHRTFTTDIDTSPGTRNISKNISRSTCQPSSL
jgi:hypothetical protein